MTAVVVAERAMRESFMALFGTYSSGYPLGTMKQKWTIDMARRRRDVDIKNSCIKDGSFQFILAQSHFHEVWHDRLFDTDTNYSPKKD
jgi:hypothetical protein